MHYYHEKNVKVYSPTRGDCPVCPVAAALARLMVEVLVITVDTVKKSSNYKHLYSDATKTLCEGYGIRMGCPFQR